MFWNDVSFLVVSSSVTGKFKDFSSKVLHDSGEIYRGQPFCQFSCDSFVSSLGVTTLATISRQRINVCVCVCVKLDIFCVQEKEVQYKHNINTT